MFTYSHANTPHGQSERAYSLSYLINSGVVPNYAKNKFISSFVNATFDYLEVNSKASNLACRAELGRLPLIIVAINEKIMKYLIYRNDKDNESMVKQSFLMLKNLHSVNNAGFYSSFVNMKDKTIHPLCLGIVKIRSYTNNIKEKYIYIYIYIYISCDTALNSQRN